VDGNKCAVQAEGRAHFLQGGVGAGLHQLAQFIAAIFVDEGLAPAAVALGGDVSDAAALAKEFFHHAEGYIKAVCNLGAGGIVFVAGLEDAEAQIKRECIHQMQGWQKTKTATIKIKLL
jgi:hypothetical protein